MTTEHISQQGYNESDAAGEVKVRVDDEALNVRQRGGGFRYSNYGPGDVSVTTDGDQYDAIAQGAEKIRIAVMGANKVYFAFGTTSGEATARLASGAGICFPAGHVECLDVPANAAYYAYQADTGTTLVNMRQGV